MLDTTVHHVIWQVGAVGVTDMTYDVSRGPVCLRRSQLN